ncbi:hypothetical protein GOP47_0009955 [Adiantum capillus-veneris]|uniref:Uncharacterized protein n=1 Tax=Adiantum capillus-veneris TaxID=13818 RepID=A0A9D4ZHQ2_ADICA|nr:hypothetical protein GOP47_0009955 [Adiantum capillus-veneris]
MAKLWTSLQWLFTPALTILGDLLDSLHGHTTFGSLHSQLSIPLHLRASTPPSDNPWARFLLHTTSSTSPRHALPSLLPFYGGPPFNWPALATGPPPDDGLKHHLPPRSSPKQRHPVAFQLAPRQSSVPPPSCSTVPPPLAVSIPYATSAPRAITGLSFSCSLCTPQVSPSSLLYLHGPPPCTPPCTRPGIHMASTSYVTLLVHYCNSPYFFINSF